MPKQPVGVFVRGDAERVAYTPHDVVHLKATGWRPKADTEPTPQPSQQVTASKPVQSWQSKPDDEPTSSNS